MLYLMSDLDLPLRGRCYREPDGPHIAIARGCDLDAALDHLDARPDCRALAIVGLPAEAPDLALLAGRRLLVCDPQQHLIGEYTRAGLEAGADVEWLSSGRLDVERLAAWALPAAALILAAGPAPPALVEVAGRRLVQHAAVAASDGGCHAVNAVYTDEAVREALGNGVTSVRSPQPDGEATPLRLGLQSLPEEAAAALLMPAEGPLVGARTVALLLRAWRREGAPPAIAAAAPGGSGWRPPLVVDRSLWPELAEMSPGVGPDALFASRPELIQAVPAVPRRGERDGAAGPTNVLHLHSDAE